MVEQLTLNQRVGGSSPPRFTKLPVLFLLSRNSILSPLESVDLGIEFLAHTTTPKGWPVLFNSIALPSISSKSLKFRSVLFSIRSAPTNTFIHILRPPSDRLSWHGEPGSLPPSLQR